MNHKDIEVAIVVKLERHTQQHSVREKRQWQWHGTGDEGSGSGTQDTRSEAEVDLRKQRHHVSTHTCWNQLRPPTQFHTIE